MSRSGFPRRAFLALPALLSPALGAARPAIADEAAQNAFADGVTVLSSGPSYGYIAGWAKLLTPHLLDGLPPDIPSRFDAMGGPDGVTVCNAFGARLDPDGSTMMFTPGAALLAWLEGDSRVKYDPGHWIATLIGATPAVLVGRRTLDRVSRRRPLRIGVTNPIGPELAALLALDLLGTPVTLVFGQGDTASLINGLRNHSLDLAFVSGPKLQDGLAMAASAGARPLFSTGALGCDASAARDPQQPNIPSFVEAAAAMGIDLPEDDRFDGYQAAAAAASICFAAVLPDLVRPATLAQWRRGAELISDSLAVAAVAVPQEVRLLTDVCAASFLGEVTRSAAAVDSLRMTMQRRYGWRAS